MKDHYRPQKMALWMNLIPDLQSAAIANQARSRGKIILPSPEDSDEAMLDYRLYNELLPFVPKLKNLDYKIHISKISYIFYTFSDYNSR